jgi:MFS family permease
VSGAAPTGTDASPSPSGSAVTRWRAAFAHRGFNFFQGARLLSILAQQMQSIAIGWQIYATTGRPIDLAWSGLAQFFPAVTLTLVTGHAADRFDRRSILAACHGAMAILSLLLCLLATGHAGDGGRLGVIYAVLVGVGTARAFLGPASQSILPSLVPIEDFGNAVAWSSSLWQVATIVGPSLGGFVYALSGGGKAVYALAAGGSAGAMLMVLAMPRIARRAGPARSSILAGVRYVKENPIVLGAISLDLFAVLLGGATALFPVYARDILRLGPWALGILRSAPAAGAALTGIALAVWPIRRAAGSKMFACVALFGVATIAFGVSRSFALSLVALLVIGASDMVSVFVRSALVQLATPDAMRGRVSAVNMVFIGASNELGEFESGVTAQWFGPVQAVVLGGLGTLLVVAIWAWKFPALRKVDTLESAAAA